MSDVTQLCSPSEPVIDHSDDLRTLLDSERNALITSAVLVDGQWIILSRYGDEIWRLDGFTRNARACDRKIDFSNVPTAFQNVMKAMMYRYMQRGRTETGRPKGATVFKNFSDSKTFMRYLESLKVNHLGAVTPLICATYVAACKAHRQSRPSSKGKPLSQGGLHSRLIAVESVYELSQYTDDPMPQHPWQDTSAGAMAGRSRRIEGGMTPLIPDDIFCTVFERAYQQVDQGKQLLDFRDELDAVVAQQKGLSAFDITRVKKRQLELLGWTGGVREFNKALIDLRTACYIVLASTSGCRNHELVNLQSGAHHRTEDDEGTIYHWMRSRSAKTDAGLHDWMIPLAAVRTLRLMERWSAPYQAMVAAEVAQRRRTNSRDPQIGEALEHRYALFLSIDFKKERQVRALTSSSWDAILKKFGKDCGLSWKLATHQFRRKFANYAAHSRFGDLRYLREHYAHWSLDMTLSYAMDDSWGQHLDLDLYADIQGELEDIKLGAVDNWLSEEPLAGGYGQALKRWAREPENLLIFKDHATMLKSISESTSIRSNGHAYCTADDGGCVGNTLERTRCGAGCGNAVIERRHSPIYQRLYDDLKGLRDCSDIGESGRQRIERDLQRCHDVLTQLGMDPEL